MYNLCLILHVPYNLEKLFKVYEERSTDFKNLSRRVFQVIYEENITLDLLTSILLAYGF